MRQRTMGRGVLWGMIVGGFLGGFLCGSVSQRYASAQLKDVGGAVLQKTGESGGVLGSAAELGSSLVEMQQHVNGLQKNLDTLKKVQSVLGGGK